MELKKILKDLLLEKEMDVSSIESDVAGSGAADDVESNLSKYMSVDKGGDFFTVGALAIEPFKINFNIIESEGNDKELEEPQILNIVGLARVENSKKVNCQKTGNPSFRGKECFDLDGGDMVLRVKEKNGNFLSLLFRGKDITKTYAKTNKGETFDKTKVTHKGLHKNKYYTVKIGGNLQRIAATNNPTTPNPNSGGGGSYTPPPGFSLSITRETQIAYLTQLFSKKGKDLWSLMEVNEGTPIPSGFGDRAVKNDKDWIGKYYELLFKEGSLNKKMKPKDKDKWVEKITENKETLGLIHWVRNTRKGDKAFQSKIASNMPTIGIGDKPKKSGKTKPLTQSVSKRFNLMMEDVESFTKFLHQETMDAGVLLRNLTNFMELLALMYNLDFNREETYKLCKKYDCPNYSEDKVSETVKMVMDKILSEDTGKGSKKTKKTVVSKIFIKDIKVKGNPNDETGDSDNNGGGKKGSKTTWAELARIIEKNNGTIDGKLRFKEDFPASSAGIRLQRKYDKVQFKLAKPIGDDTLIVSAKSGPDNHYMKIKFNSNNSTLTDSDVTVNACADKNCGDFEEDWDTRLDELIFNV